MPVDLLQAVLRLLLEERVSVRNLPLILEAIAESHAPGAAPEVICEHVRHRLGFQLCAGLQEADGALPLIQDDLGLSTTDHPSGRNGELLQRCQGSFGPRFLKEADDAVEKDDGQNRQTLWPLAEHPGDGCGSNQDQDHQFPELPEELVPKRCCRGLGQLVGAVADEPRRGVLCRQALLGVGDHRIMVDRVEPLFLILLEQRDGRAVRLRPRRVRHRLVAGWRDRLVGGQRHAGRVARLDMRVLADR